MIYINICRQTGKNSHWLSERLAPLGIMGDPTKGPPYTRRYDSAVMYGGFQGELVVSRTAIQVWSGLFLQFGFAV